MWESEKILPCLSEWQLLPCFQSLNNHNLSISRFSNFSLINGLNFDSFQPNSVSSSINSDPKEKTSPLADKTLFISQYFKVSNMIISQFGGMSKKSYLGLYEGMEQEHKGGKRIQCNVSFYLGPFPASGFDETCSQPTKITGFLNKGAQRDEADEIQGVVEGNGTTSRNTSV